MCSLLFLSPTGSSDFHLPQIPQGPGDGSGQAPTATGGAPGELPRGPRSATPGAPGGSLSITASWMLWPLPVTAPHP